MIRSCDYNRISYGRYVKRNEDSSIKSVVESLGRVGHLESCNWEIS